MDFGNIFSSVKDFLSRGLKDVHSGTNVVSDSVKNYFEPTPEVRARDYVREVSKGVAGIPLDILRGAARFSYSAGESIPRLLNPNLANKEVPPTKIPGLGFLGEIQSYQSEYARKSREGKSPSILGVAGQTAVDEPIGVAFKPLFLAGGFLAKKYGPKAVDTFADITTKIFTKEGVKKEAEKLGVKLTDDIAEQVAKSTNREEIKNIASPLFKTVETTVAKNVPEELQSISETISKREMTKEQFLKELEDGLNGQNLTRRETAQNVVKVLEKKGMTPEDFYKASVVSKPAIKNAEEIVAKDWEENYADKFGKLDEELGALQNQLKEAKAKERLAISGKIEKLQQEQLNMENDYLNKYGNQKIDDGTPELPPIKETIKPEPRAERSLPKTAVERGVLPEDALVKMRETMYDVKSNTSTIQAAKDFVKQFPQKAKEYVIKPLGGKTANNELLLQNAVGIQLVEDLGMRMDAASAVGNNELRSQLGDEMAEIFDVLAERATTSGQAIQILSKLGQNSFYVQKRFMERMTNKLNKTLKEMGSESKIVLSNEQKQQIAKLQEESLLAKTEEERAWKMAEAQKVIADEYVKLLPRGQKAFSAINKFRYIAMLLNVKTFFRNVLGNSVFATMEAVSQAVSSPLDRLVSKTLGGRRSVGMPTLTLKYWQYLKKGGKDSLKEISAGIDLSKKNKYEIPTRYEFQSKVMKALDKALSISLKVPDRAVFNANFESELASLMKLNKVKEATPEMIDLATSVAEYRTFTDDSVISQMFSKGRGALNMAAIGPSGAKVGLGDLIVPFVKTPANLISRGFAYTPLGFGKTAYYLAKLLPEMTGKKALSPQSLKYQRRLVDSTSQALVGSVGVVGVAYKLAEMGLITGAFDKQNISAEKTREEYGSGSYKINLSGLNRLISGEDPAPQPNDKLMAYGWLMPLSLPMGLGADLYNKVKKGEGENYLQTLNNMFEAASSPVFEQPLTQGIRKMTSYTDIGTGMWNALKDVPSSYIPTLSNQFRQFVDPYKRSKRNQWNQYIVDSMINRIPFASKTLTPSVSMYGEIQQVNQNQTEKNWVENAWNIFANPSTFTKIDATKSEEIFLYNLFNETGRTSIFPDYVQSKASFDIKKDGETISVTPDQETKAMMQMYIGRMSKAYVKKLVETPSFQRKPSEEKVKTITNMLNDFTTASKIIFLDSEMDKKTQKEIRILVNEYKRNEDDFNAYLERRF